MRKRRRKEISHTHTSLGFNGPRISHPIYAQFNKRVCVREREKERESVVSLPFNFFFLSFLAQKDERMKAKEKREEEKNSISFHRTGEGERLLRGEHRH